MDGHEDLHDGAQLGYEAAERSVKLAEDYCASQRQYLAFANEARMNELSILAQDLIRRGHDLDDRLRRAVPPEELRSNRRRAVFCWIVGILLSVAAFFFSVLSFTPYRLGQTGQLVCLGVALVVPYAVHELLESWASKILLKMIVTVVFLAAVTGGALLAGIRADLLARQVDDTSAAVTIDGENTSTPNNQGSFYQETKQSLRLVLIFLALAIDLGAGVAFHRALELGRRTGEDREELSTKKTEIYAQLAGAAVEWTTCANAPAKFEAAFWREFYRAMLTHTARKGLQKLLVLAVGSLLVGAGISRAQGKPLDLVIAVDLSASVGSRGPDGKTDFEKNVTAIAELLGKVPAGARVRILGITADSFAEPDILLSAKLDTDAGYFGERLSGARRQIAHAWQQRAARLSPTAKGTDIVGMLSVAEQMFQQASTDETRMLVIYSDMRQATPSLRLESRERIARASLIKDGQYKSDLKDVQVFVLGVDGVGKDAAYWDALRRFWMSYLQSASATVCEYSVLRDVPRI